MSPNKVTPEMRAAFRRAYREGGFWTDRLDYALDKMIEATPKTTVVAPGEAVKAFREYLSVHPVGTQLSGFEKDEIALELACIALDFLPVGGAS